MKYIVLFLFPLFLASCGGSDKVEVGQKTTMEIDTLFDAGTVVKGEIINAKFKVKNTGDYPLVFGEVRGSCTCTVAEKPEEPILPGKSGVIVAQINTNEVHSKLVNKSVTVMANTEPHLTVVMIKGKIK
jgi:hypothetical protein